MTGGEVSRLALAFVSMAVAALLAVQPLSAALLTAVVEDPVGDALYAPGIVGQPYQDTTKASITLRDGRFIFIMDVAAPIPSSPSLPPGTMLEEWSWRLDTNPATFPAGFPYSQGNARPADFMVFVLWDGKAFTGFLIDRAPLLSGGEAVLRPIPFLIKGSEVMASLDAAMMGNPTLLVGVHHRGLAHAAGNEQRPHAGLSPRHGLHPLALLKALPGAPTSSPSRLPRVQGGADDPQPAL